jgi:DNA-directed RNA polymerase II subunit RPB1
MVKSGSKGSFINLSQICACLGQQSLEGSRIVAEKGTRTLPCFAHDDYSLASRGMVFNSFALGLTPPELFYHAIGGREGLVDTAVKTSQTGYLQRRMNKSMEESVVREDGTIRNSLGEIISFRWGSGGMHPARVERVKMHILREGTASIRRAYLPREAAIILELRQRVLAAKANVLCGEVDVRVLLPFHSHRLRKEMLRGRRPDHRHADPVYEDLLGITHSAVVKLAVVELFCDRNARYLSEDEVRRYKDRVRHAIENAHSVDGESAGCLAAQSVGEPSTQMTLNTFHTAGVAAKNVTLGLPRLKEILDGSKNAKTPCTTIRFRPPFAESPRFAEYVANTLPLTRLGDVVQQCNVVHDPEWDVSVVETDRPIVAADAVLREGVGTSRHASHVLRFQLHREIMSARCLTPPMIRTILQERLQERAHVVSSETNSIEWVVRVRFAQVKDMMEKGGLGPDQEPILCHQAMNVLLDTVVVSGHPLVSSADNATQKRTTVTAEGEIDEREECVVNVYGTFLADCASTTCVDWRRCTSNDLWEVYGTLGIEACAHVLFDQLKAVVSFDGTYVADKHLVMITDTICRGGGIMPLNRHGINKTETSPLMRCSFEETADVLYNAAVHSEQENAEGVTSCIMMGQLARFGTGGVEVLFPRSGAVDRILRPDAGRRVLRSTCRCHVDARQEQECMEYVPDDVRPSANRLPPAREEPTRMRAKFRHLSPRRSPTKRT